MIGYETLQQFLIALLLAYLLGASSTAFIWAIYNVGKQRGEKK